MNTRFPLAATKREEIGHRAHQLRKSGFVPGTVYGKTTESISVTVEMESFLTVYKQAGETHLVDLAIAGKTYPVLISIVQQHPVTRDILNVEFLVVNLTEKIKNVVPVVVIGESPAIKQNLGTLLLTLQEIEVESLPANIPEGIEVDVTSLEAVGDEITVEGITKIPNVEILTDPSQTVVKIGALTIEEEVPVVEEEGTEQAEETSETPTATTEQEKTTEEK